MDNASTQISYLAVLSQAGLEPNQALIYQVLIKSGPLPAGKIHQKTPLKRGLVYKILDELTTLGLVIKRDKPGTVAIFEPSHPLKLKELAEKKEEQAKQAQNVLSAALSQMTSEFNLVLGRPGVQFYEGKEGVWEVLKDSLAAQDVIYSYADIESIEKYIKEINTKYVAARERLHVKKQGIVLDTPFNRKFLSDYHKSVTNTKLITYKAPPFASVMQIYDGKVSYINLMPDKMLGIIISDQQIFTMHKWLFEWSWNMANDIEAKKNGQSFQTAQTGNIEHPLE